MKPTEERQLFTATNQKYFRIDPAGIVTEENYSGSVLGRCGPFGRNTRLVAALDGIVHLRPEGRFC